MSWCYRKGCWVVYILFYYFYYYCFTVCPFPAEGCWGPVGCWPWGRIAPRLWGSCPTMPNIWSSGVLCNSNRGVLGVWFRSNKLHCRPCLSCLHFSKRMPWSPANIIHRADVLLWMSHAWRAALCYSFLTRPFLFSHVGRTSWDLLRFPGQKTKWQDEVWPAPSSLCCSASHCSREKRRHLLLGRVDPPHLGMQWSIPLPCSPPRMSLGSAFIILFSKTDAAWRSLGLFLPWEDTSQLGTIWSPFGLTLCSKQGLRSWWDFTVFMDLCHLNFSPVSQLSAQQV